MSAPTDIVVSHVHPDFDAYASLVAAALLHPGAVPVYGGSRNRNVQAFHALHGSLLGVAEAATVDTSAVTTLVVVDTREPKRIGEFSRIADDPAVRVIAYDHHPCEQQGLRISRDLSVETGATATILVNEIRRRGISLSPVQASLFLLGIHEDTGSLRFLGTTPDDAEAVAYLMEAGADVGVLQEFLDAAPDEGQRALLELFAHSLESWEIHGRNITVVTAETTEEVDIAAVVSRGVVEGLARPVVFALVQLPGRVQVVARSRVEDVDVGAVVECLGGGGHMYAASARMENATLASAEIQLRAALEHVLPRSPRAGEIASSPVRTITPVSTMADAAREMSQWGHGGLPVVEDGRLVGMVSRKDVDKAVRHGLEHAPVKGFMARDPVTVTAETPLHAIQEIFVARGIGRVPVLEGDALVGIVTRKDLLRALRGAGFLGAADSEARERARERFLASFGRILPAEVQEVVRRLGHEAHDAGVNLYVVGGFVRDMLLGVENLDIDVVVDGDAIAFADSIAPRMSARVKAHRRFGTAVLVLSKTLHVDVVSARAEYYERPGALPSVERSTIRQDLFRRDFTLNAIAASVMPEDFGTITDPFGGVVDLDSGCLRVLHPLSFVEDPTRLLRAARFEKRFGFSLDEASCGLARVAADSRLLDEVSGARVREELLDIIDEECPGEVLERVADLGALRWVTPSDADVARALAAMSTVAARWESAVETLGRTGRRRVALIAAIASAAPHDRVLRWMSHLRFGSEYRDPALAVSDDMAALRSSVGAPERMKRSWLYRALENVPDEARAVAWILGDERLAERVELFSGVLSEIRAAVTGEDLVTLGLEPGPVFSAILARALDDRLDEIAVGREAELQNLSRLAVEMRS